MSRRTTKAVLSRDEISLLINSEEPKNKNVYGNLYNVLLQIDDLKAITLQKLIELNLDDKGVGALTYNKNSLMDNVKGEWYVNNQSAEDPDKKVKCGLCNTPNRYLFYIRNRLNSKQLNVGSFCMTKFPGIEGYTDYKYQLNQNIRTQKESMRRTEFYERIPNAINILDSANYYFDNLPILLPSEIYYPLKDVVTELRLIYTKYIKTGKIPFPDEKNPFELFKHKVNQYNRLKCLSDAFIKENRNKQFICKRPEIDWMNENKKINLLKSISDNKGFYSEQTIKEITSVNFIKENFEIFSKCNDKNIHLITFNDDNKSIYFTIKDDKFLFMYKINIKKFMQRIGVNCFFKEEFKYYKRDLFLVSKIMITDNNLYSALNSISYRVESLGYVILIDNFMNDLYLYNRSNKFVKTFSMKGFLEMYSSYKIQVNTDKFLGVILTHSKWMSVEEQGRIGIDEKVGKLFYQQFVVPNQ